MEKFSDSDLNEGFRMLNNFNKDVKKIISSSDLPEYSYF